MWIYTKLFLTACFWGGTFIAGRVVAQHVGPFSAAFIRFVIATAILLAFVRSREGRFTRLDLRQAGMIALLGMTGICFYNFFFFSGLKRIDAGRAALIIATNPVFTALLSAYFFRERLTLLRCLGILVSVGGALVVITKGHLAAILTGGIGTGEIYIFGCVLSWAAFSLLGKKAMASISPLTAIAYASLIGTIGLLVPALYEGLLRDLPRFSLADWVSLGYLGVFGTAIGFVWFYEGIKRLGPAAASQFINFVPVSAVLLAYFILHEPLTYALLFGMVWVSLGVYLVNRGPIPRNR